MDDLHTNPVKEVRIARIREFKTCVDLVVKDIRNLRRLWRYPLRLNTKYWLIYQALMHTKLKLVRSHDQATRIDLRANVELLREKAKLLEQQIKREGWHQVLAKSVPNDLFLNIIKNYKFLDLCTVQSVIATYV